MIPTDSGMRLIELTRKAREVAQLLADAIRQAEANPRIEPPSADEACAYLDRLPTVNARKRRPLPSSISHAVVNALAGHGMEWVTASALAREIGGGLTVPHVCQALGRAMRRSVVERRPVHGRALDRYEWRYAPGIANHA
jgi:hypothetical protein